MIEHLNLKLAMFLHNPAISYHWKITSGGAEYGNTSADAIGDISSGHERPTDAQLIDASLDNIATMPAVVNFNTLPTDPLTLAPGSIAANGSAETTATMPTANAFTVCVLRGGAFVSAAAGVSGTIDISTDTAGSYRVVAIDRTTNAAYAATFEAM